MNKLVTVIVPTIGRPKYIKQTIESIIIQDYDEIEILLSDNFSEFPVKLILGGMVDSRIKIVERNRRYEFSEHMNLCIDEARGFYVMILSDDDLICPSYISSMVHMLSGNEDVFVGLGLQKVLNENDAGLGEFQRGKNAIELFDGRKFTQRHFQRKKSLPIYTYLSLFAKRSEVLDAGGFKLYQDGLHADNYLFYSLALKGKVGVSSALMGYRIYLASSGLRTSFEKLYLATLAYDKDMSSLVWGLANKPFLEKFNLRLLIKTSSARMMFYRLLRIYKARIGGFLTAINLARIIIGFLPRNIFSGFELTKKLK